MSDNVTLVQRLSLSAKQVTDGHIPAGLLMGRQLEPLLWDLIRAADRAELTPAAIRIEIRLETERGA